MVEFAKPTALLDDFEENKKVVHQRGKKKKKKEVSLLKWGNPYFGLYERYGKSNLDQCWAHAGPGNDPTMPTAGDYFQTDEPLKLTRFGKGVKFVQRMKSIND